MLALSSFVLWLRLWPSPLVTSLTKSGTTFVLGSWPSRVVLARVVLAVLNQRKAARGQEDTAVVGGGRGAVEDHALMSVVR